jgi:3'-5' exoribonuclease
MAERYNSSKYWNYYKKDTQFVEKFKKWPGGKGNVHHAYQHGLLEHTFSMIKMVKTLQNEFTFPIDIEKTIIGAFLHDIGKLDSYDFNIKTSMTNIGRLQDHSTLGYYKFRKDIETLNDLKDKNIIIEEIGHIILSHHGIEHSIIKPMTIEARIVSYADFLDSDSNHMQQQLKHNSDEQGWIFDTLNDQFYFKRPKRRKGKLFYV